MADTEKTHDDLIATLDDLHQKVQWLSAWTIHNANHIRPSRDGLKVGGHQASSASLAAIMTALYFHVLRPNDRVAVKPHASPAYHAIQYLLGRQSQEQLENFRALGGAQSYPSRTKDKDDVDFSTGSVGLGVAVTAFASLVQDHLTARALLPADKQGRMIALMGDAELDEGNIYEALIEGYKQQLKNCWWIIDYNRQSLDAVTHDRMFNRFADIFETTGWKVVTLKYGKALEEAFRQPGGPALRDWIDACPNDLYSALTYKGGAAWRERILADAGKKKGVKALLAQYDDAGLHALMTNLAGHDLSLLVETFDNITDERPHVFICYTIKGHGLPFQGHKDNHAGLMNPGQMAEFKASKGIADGQEWHPFAGMEDKAQELQSFLANVPFAGRAQQTVRAAKLAVPELADPGLGQQSTQVAFGKIMNDLGRSKSEFAARIMTTSPDVTVSTNLGGWVNQRRLFANRQFEDRFKAERVVSPQMWSGEPDGQHMELGIAENNLFLALAAMGLSADLFGTRLIPIGTLYDPFINRGLDALNYACYQDARFLLVATPSGITLAAEGGAHQSIHTPLIGMAQPNLLYFEPTYVDELRSAMAWAFRHMQEEDGSSVYLRLSTRALNQPERDFAAIEADYLKGAYWLKKPASGTAIELVLAFTGAVAPEVLEAYDILAEDIEGLGVLAVSSPDLLHRDWMASQRTKASGTTAPSHIETLLSAATQGAGIVSVIDGAPTTLSWLGSVLGHRQKPLGVETFGQSADVPDIYRVHRIDADAVIDAAASLYAR